MSITKKSQWLKCPILVDEYGRLPSLADVPLQPMPREDAFKKRGLSEEEIEKIWEEVNNPNKIPEDKVFRPKKLKKRKPFARNYNY